jgi:hypothetical protein
MKPIFQINYRYRLITLAARTSHVSRKTDYNYPTTTLDGVDGGCVGVGVGDCKPPFRASGQDYFAREAHHDLASEAMVFCLLMLATIVPLLDGASAVVGLLRSTRGAF